MEGCGWPNPMLHHRNRQRQRQPSLRKNGEGWGTRKFKNKFKNKITSKTNQPQDELPEWYHQRRDEVNSGKYGRERAGHPPALAEAKWRAQQLWERYQRELAAARQKQQEEEKKKKEEEEKKKCEKDPKSCKK